MIGVLIARDARDASGPRHLPTPEETAALEFVRAAIASLRAPREEGKRS